MPFQYPEIPHQRKHGPTGYNNYKTYKEWLRDEFEFRCVYCQERERWYPTGEAAFSVDHVKPKGDPKYAHLLCDYENMVYACIRCNSAKGKELVLDPCSDGLGRHLRVLEDGSVEGVTNEGKDLIDILGLDLLDAVEERLKAIRLLLLGSEQPDDHTVRALVTRHFGFPSDLPDLCALRPLGNTRPDGVKQSHHRLREAGNLPEVY